MPRNEGLRGPYTKRRNCWCMWCGEPFEAARPDATTCGQFCRTHLSRFKRLTGFAPEEAVGRLTAHKAYTELVEQLLDAERTRREMIAAVLTGGAAKLFEVHAQVEARKATAKRTG